MQEKKQVHEKHLQTQTNSGQPNYNKNITKGKEKVRTICETHDKLITALKMTFMIVRQYLIM